MRRDPSDRLQRFALFHLRRDLVTLVLEEGAMNFSNLLNHDEGDPSGFDSLSAQAQHASRMSFDYLNSEQNLSPAAAIASPAFFSTPTEFVGESDHEGVGFAGADLDHHFNRSFHHPDNLLASSGSLYNSAVGPATFPDFPQYPSFPTQPPNLTQQGSTSAFPPFAFSPSLEHSQDLFQTASGPPPASSDPAPQTPNEKAKKSTKTKSKSKSKLKGDDAGLHSDGSSSAGAVKPSSRPKSKGSAKSKRNALLASSNHSSPAPSPGPSSLANEVHVDTPDPENDFDREAFSNPVPLGTANEKDSRPLTTDHLRAAADPDSALSLAAPFRDYVPPRVGPTGAVISDSEDEDDEEDAARKRAQARRSAALAAKGKSRARIEEESREEADDRLYCVCRERYEPERMMIACDRCEEWYHIECVEIPNDSVELVDQFFCPNCQAKYSQTTTWLSACARPTCQRPAVALSKYCSDYCGISVVSARLELLKLANGTDPNTFWGRVEGSHRKEAKVINSSAPSTAATDQTDSALDSQAVEDARTLSRLESKLEETNQRRDGLSAAISMVEKRLSYLKIAIKRWERLCQATADGLANAGLDQEAGEAATGDAGDDDGAVETKKSNNKRRAKKKSKAKKKGPVAATSRPEAQCGLDIRLVYDEEAWREWIDCESVEVKGEDGELREEPGGKNLLAAQDRGEDQGVLAMAMEMLSGVCLVTRKKCERHTGWQKLREADFQVEKAVLHRRLDRLNSLSQSLEAQISLHQQATAFRLSNYNRAASPSRLISVEAYMEEQEALRPRVKPGAAGSKRGRRSTSPIVNRQSATPSFRRGDFVAGGEDGDRAVEVPSELLPFLSRAEIAKLKAQRK
ncbi:hypothetical protein JCM3766R1_000699 [Sporobolomyces carnicolor]